MARLGRNGIPCSTVRLAPRQPWYPFPALNGPACRTGQPVRQTDYSRGARAERTRRRRADTSTRTLHSSDRNRMNSPQYPRVPTVPRVPTSTQSTELKRKRGCCPCPRTWRRTRTRRGMRIRDWPADRQTQTQTGQRDVSIPLCPPVIRRVRHLLLLQARGDRARGGAALFACLRCTNRSVPAVQSPCCLFAWRCALTNCTAGAVLHKWRWRMYSRVLAPDAHPTRGNVPESERA
jgi:hypothetical protein